MVSGRGDGVDCRVRSDGAVDTAGARRAAAEADPIRRGDRRTLRSHQPESPRRRRVPFAQAAYQCRDDAGDVELAIADFDAAIRFQPQDPEAFYSRAIAFRKMGDEEKSQADDAMARKLDSRIAEEYEHLPSKTDVDVLLPEKTVAAPEVEPETKPEEDDESAWVLRRRREAAAEAKRKQEEDDALDPFDTAASRQRRTQPSDRSRDRATSSARTRSSARDAEKELDEMRDRMTRPADKPALPAEDPFRTSGALTGRPIRGGTLPLPRATMPGSPLMPGTSGDCRNRPAAQFIRRRR